MNGQGVHFLMEGEFQNFELTKRMSQLGIDEKDLKESFVLGSGAGGQKINKTHSCVLLSHEKSGTVIKCQKTRYRSRNRELARIELCKRLQDEIEERRAKAKAKRAVNRKLNRKPSRRATKKRLDGKSKRGYIKSMRKPPRADT